MNLFCRSTLAAVALLMSSLPAAAAQRYGGIITHKLASAAIATTDPTPVAPDSGSHQAGGAVDASLNSPASGTGSTANVQATLPAAAAVNATPQRGPVSGARFKLSSSRGNNGAVGTGNSNGGASNPPAVTGGVVNMTGGTFSGALDSAIVPDESAGTADVQIFSGNHTINPNLIMGNNALAVGTGNGDGGANLVVVGTEPTFGTVDASSGVVNHVGGMITTTQENVAGGWLQVGRDGGTTNTAGEKIVTFQDGSPNAGSVGMGGTFNLSAGAINTSQGGWLNTDPRSSLVGATGTINMNADVDTGTFAGSLSNSAAGGTYNLTGGLLNNDASGSVDIADLPFASSLGSIVGTDYALIDNAFSVQAGPLPIASVPEPSTALLAAIACIGGSAFLAARKLRNRRAVTS